MKKNKKGKKANVKIKERKSLSIANYGDFVVIKNRSTLAAGLSGILMLALCIAGGIALKDAWKIPMFAILFSLVIVSIVYSYASMIFSKITLDSLNMQMNVYNPFKKQYKFEDVSYVEIKSSKPKDGMISHRVITYIGDGKKNVELTTMSLKQAEELASLLRGMLDNAAMIYPEGDEEPFDFDEDKKTKQGVMSFGFKRNKKDDSNEKNTPVLNEKEQKDREASMAVNTEAVNERTPLTSQNTADEKSESVNNDSYFEQKEIENNSEDLDEEK